MNMSNQHIMFISFNHEKRRMKGAEKDPRWIQVFCNVYTGGENQPAGGSPRISVTKNEADAVRRGLKVAKLIAIQFLQTIDLPAEFNITYTIKKYHVITRVPNTWLKELNVILDCFFSTKVSLHICAFFLKHEWIIPHVDLVVATTTVVVYHCANLQHHG